MKKILSILLCFILLLSFTNTVFASDGDTNIDGRGGGTEDGTGTNKWTPGDDGVRVTIVRESDKYAVTKPIDFGNRNPTDIDMYFGLHSKLYYQSKGLTVVTSSHPGIIPDTPMPTVVSPGGGVNIAAVKKYFSDKNTIKYICSQVDFDFEKLTTGGYYVVMLEPLVYITYNGIRFCMTATEAALYNRMTSGDLRAKLGNITSQNLPLAMFLEKPDLGFPAWGGATSGIRSDGEIISSLGIGTVRFKGGACCNHQLDCPCITDETNPSDCECKKNHPDEECGEDNPSCDCEPADDPDNPAQGTKYYDYHTDTDVVTTIEVKDHGWWVYTWKEYYATASAKTEIKPAEQVPTAKRGAYSWEMRSGYGINLSVDAKVFTTGKNGDTTGAQNAVVTFPEFNYESYNRVMEPIRFSKFELQKNVYSMYEAPVHFTPIWYPDDAEYAPQTKVIDIWTPGGQLYVYGDDALTIRDGTYFDDWHIAPKLVRE